MSWCGSSDTVRRTADAGIPFPPIDERDAAPALDALLESLAPQICRLVMALDGDELVGWLSPGGSKLGG
jgi:hypothetical protein